jgi:AAA+ ATPase superfamily predicted ATPase
MDPSPEYVFLQLLSVAVYGSLSGLRLFKNRKMNNLFVVLSTRKVGLTSTLKKVKENMDGKVILVDKDDIIESQDEQQRNKLRVLMEDRKDAFDLLFYPMVKQYLQHCSKVFKGMPLVLFVNDEHLIKYLKVPKQNVISLVPTVSMFQMLMETYKVKNDEASVNTLIKSREDLIVSGFNKVLLKDWNELENILQKIISVNKRTPHSF